jgi:hypothetical protein
MPREPLLDIPTGWGLLESLKLTLAQTATFASLWKHWKLGADDLRRLELQLMEDPLAGKVMRNTGGVRKARFAPGHPRFGKKRRVSRVLLLFPRL